MFFIQLILELTTTMSKCFEAEALDLFREPARVIVSGFSNSGKSELVRKLIIKYQHKFTNIIMCGVEEHPLQSHPQVGPKLSLHAGIVDPLTDIDESHPYSILYVLDDVFTEAVQNSHVMDVFTKGRHKSISTFFITQNVFHGGKHARNISINASHFLLLRTRDINQVEILGRQIFGKALAQKFSAVYREAVLKRPFSHLLIDLALNTPSELQLRSNITGEPPGEVVFLQWET